MFDYTSKPANVRRLNKICKAFIAEIAKDTRAYDDVEISFVRDKEGFAIHADGDDIDMLYDYRALDHTLECNKAFDNYVHNRWRYTKGFADVTLAILHEMGHYATAYSLRKYDRAKELVKLYEKASLNNWSWYEIQTYYTTQMKDERKATEWGMNWLGNPQNRKTAKAFEKAFFKCWKGEY